VCLDLSICRHGCDKKYFIKAIGDFLIPCLHLNSRRVGKFVTVMQPTDVWRMTNLTVNWWSTSFKLDFRAHLTRFEHTGFEFEKVTGFIHIYLSE